MAMRLGTHEGCRAGTENGVPVRRVGVTPYDGGARSGTRCEIEQGEMRLGHGLACTAAESCVLCVCCVYMGRLPGEATYNRCRGGIEMLAQLDTRLWSWSAGCIILLSRVTTVTQHYLKP